MRAAAWILIALALLVAGCGWPYGELNGKHYHRYGDYWHSYQDHHHDHQREVAE